MSAFDKKDNINRTFPAESGDGAVTYTDNAIVYEGKDETIIKVNLDDLQYAYVIVNREKESFLFLFDHHRHYIPTHYSGFKETYEMLSAKCVFDDAVFFEYVLDQEPLKKIIWRRTYQPTYRVLQTAHTDYAEGFEIQSPEKQFISWDATYEELAQNPYVRFYTSPYIQKTLKFMYPIRIGNILLEDFRAYYDCIREDVSVLQFYSDCFDASGSDKSYADLKNILLRDFGIDRNRLNYERADQKRLNYSFGGMRLTICYTYDTEWQFDGGYTALSVENKRDYFSLLIDQAYEDSIVISNFVELKSGIHVSEDYKRNSRIKRRPKKITDQFQDKPLIWFDEQNNKIGFSSRFFSQVFDTKEITALRIQNVLPARGTGGSYIELTLVNPQDEYVIVMKGDCYAFDSYAGSIKALTGKEVILEVPYYDC